MATIGVQGDNAYVVVTDPGVTWSAADAAATATTGHLVTATSAAEDAFVRATWRGAATGDYWIGLTDAVTEGVFEWVTGEVFAFSNWGTGEPNNLGDEDYVTGDFPGRGNWNDERNQNTSGVAGYVVEFDSAGAFRDAANPFRNSADSFLTSDADDTVKAGRGDDTITGSAGSDKLTGGGGNDRFVFTAATNAGTDAIEDFDQAGDDVIALLGFGLDFAGVLAIAEERTGRVTIALGPDADLVLRGITLAELDAADFVFG